MEEKEEIVNGPMLVVNCGQYEAKFEVLDEEHLNGDSWLPKFKKAYNIKKFCRHSKAGSVDITAIDTERTWMKAILAT